MRRAPLAAVSLTVAISACALQAGSPRQGARGGEVTIPAGSVDFALPRSICDRTARVGDTVTARVTRPKPMFLPGGVYTIGIDSAVPEGLEAFLRVSRVGTATGRNLFRVDFEVDSFALGDRRGRAPITQTGADPEAVVSARLEDGSLANCYNGRIRGEMTARLVLRGR